MTRREQQRLRGLRQLAGECCQYAGRDADKRRTLLPRVLRALGYDIGWHPSGDGMRLVAKAPGDSEFCRAPEILDDLRDAAEIAPWPFELLGSDRTSWSARVQARGEFVHGRFPAATLTAAVLLWTNPQRSGLPLPARGIVAEAFPFPTEH